MNYLPFEYKKTKIDPSELNADNKCWFFFDHQPRWVFLEHTYINTCLSQYYAPFYEMPYDYSLVTNMPVEEQVIRSLKIAGRNKNYPVSKLHRIVNCISEKPFYIYEVSKACLKLNSEGLIKIESGLVSLRTV